MNKYSSAYKGLYKQALLEGLAQKAGVFVGKANLMAGKTKALIQAAKSRASDSYVMDAVRKARPQYASGVTDTGYSMHGTVLKMLEENGAIGARQIRHGFDKARRVAEDIDTGLGAMAVGKKGLATGKGLRNDLFTMKNHNYINAGKVPGANPFGDNLNTAYQAKRPSITAPIESIAPTVTGVLALTKGNELLANYREKKQNASQYSNQGG